MKFVNLIILTAILVFISCSGKKIAKTKLENGNVYAIYSDGTEKQLTFNKSDESPLLVSSKGIVVFVRKIGSGYYNSTKEIMKVEIESLVEGSITKSKPFTDGLHSTTDIIRVKSPKLSKDEDYIYFVTEKYVTGSELVRVNIETGKWDDLFTAESFEFVDHEKYKNSFLVGQSLIEDRGRDIYYKLVDAKGNVLKSFEDENSAHVFLNNLNE